VHRFVPVRLNGDREGKALMPRYGVTGYPTLIFVDAKGKIVARNGGKMPPKGFIETLRIVADTLREEPSMRLRARKNSKDVEAAARLALAAAWREDAARALPLVRHAERLDPENGTGLMGEVWNGMGDAYMYRGKNAEAIPWFERAGRFGREGERSYALNSIGWCHHLQEKRTSAVRAFESVLAMAGVPDWHKDIARLSIAIAQESKYVDKG